MKLGSFCLIVLALAVVLAPMAGCEKPAGSTPATASANSGAAPQSSASSASAASGDDSSKLTTAHAVLDKMVEAYRKAPSYEDSGTADFWEDGAKAPQRADFQVIFERPNKLRMKFYQGDLACDGKKWFGFSKDIPDQAVLREAPPAINMQMLTADSELAQALNNGFAGMSPQILLLLKERPLEVLLDGVRDQDLTLGEPVRVGDYDCFRLCFRRSDGTGEFWIDQKTFILRKMQFRDNSGAQSAAAGTDGNRIEANFERARLGGPIDPAAFKFEVPEGVESHRALMNAGPYRVIGKKLADFQLTDARGKPWSSQSMAGKVVVLHLWKTDVAACPSVVPSIQQAYEKFKDNPRVAFWAINLDAGQVEAKTIEETAQKWKLTLPILRDPNFDAAKSLKTAVVPATFFIDSQGVLQDCILRDAPVATAATTRKIEELVAGKDLAKQALDEFHEQFKTYETAVDLVFTGEAVTSTFKQAEATPAATPSQPKKLRLTSLWKRSLSGIAGNILVATKAGKPRIIVVDGFKAITEIGLDGTVGESHHAKLAADELFTILRSAVGRDGKRWYVAFGPWQQRLHVFDENLTQTLSYPEDALENRHPGVTDVELADLSGDGQVRAYVGFGGTVGVQCVSLYGKRVWNCRNLFNIGRVTATPPDSAGHRQLYCVTDAIDVAILDATGELRGSTKLAVDGIVESLVPADFAQDGKVIWCEILRHPDPRQPAAGQFTAIGRNTGGESAWKYELPTGTMQTVEPVVVGRVLPGTASQWILPGCDGSIHILAANGTLIDRFNYGAQINGLATAEIDGKPVLLISSANGIEALRVE